MHLKYLKTIIDAQNNLNRVGGLAWSANHQKLAVATADRSIILFDENGEKRDKFSTKPSGSANGKASYVVRALAFSPDSSSLAVAQSDNIVYVYKLGTSWKEKKVICNKFPQPTAVNAMVWLSIGPIIVGLEDGKVRALNCKTNRSQNLYAAEYTVVSLAGNVRGTGFISGHDDGSVIRFFIVDEPKYPSGRLFQHTSSPLALAWTQNDIAAAGCDRKIIFYNMQGQQSRVFDYSHDDNEKEFTVATCSPNGQSIAFGSYDQIRIYTWSPRQKTWIDVAKKVIKHLYSVSSLTWRSDGARLVVGSVCGAVLIFESVLKRTVWHDKFELTYVTHSQLLVKSLQESNTSVLVVESRLGLEIDDVRFMGKDNYLVAHTEDSIILCDLTRNLTSELSWPASGHNEKFYFENPNVCFIFNAGELTLIEYGENNIFGSVRTEFVNPHVISVRLNERGNTRDNKKLAYLMDMKTISVVDLITQTIISQINHESKIDWLELSETSHKILFRDKKMRLILFDIPTSRKYNLLDKVSFVQWVPQSEFKFGLNHFDEEKLSHDIFDGNSALQESIGDAVYLGLMTPQHLNRLKLLPDKYLYAEKLPKFSQPYQNMIHSHKPNKEFMQFSSHDDDRQDKSTSNEQIKLFGKSYPAISERIAKMRKYQNLSSRIDGSMNSFELSLLLRQALTKIPQIPFAYILDVFRWDLFSGNVTFDDANNYFWKLAIKEQGIHPPDWEDRTYFFDPGAKFHIADNTPYVRYFLASFIQAQIFHGLCLVTVFGEIKPDQKLPMPLHRCDLYGSKRAGKLLQKALKIGASKPWTEALFILTGSRVVKADSLLLYYEPLIEWLETIAIEYDVPVGW